MKTNLFNILDKFILRTPLYSSSLLFATKSETKDLTELVKALLQDDIFLEAIYWSSPQLYQNVIDYKAGNYNPTKESKLLLTLKKYAIRASTRCTPYGIFAGCSVKDIANKSKYPPTINQRKVRLDMALVEQIKTAIESDEEIKRNLRYSINDTLYRLPSEYRFVESTLENGKYSYQISSIEQMEFLDRIIETLQNEKKSYSELVQLLQNDYDVDEIESFLFGLIDAQFLVSELQLSLTNENEIARFKNVLLYIKNHSPNIVEKWLSLFQFIELLLPKLNNVALGNIPYGAIQQLQELLNSCGINNLPEHLFQTDLLKSNIDDIAISQQQIDETERDDFSYISEWMCEVPSDQKNCPPQANKLKKYADEIEEAVKILGKLSSGITTQEQIFARFKTLFIEKYEHCEVPLLEVLDPEFGIGFLSHNSIGDVAHNAIVENLSESQQEKFVETSYDNVQTWLQNKIEELEFTQLQNGIGITETDLKAFDDKINNLPEQVTVMGSVLHNNKIFLQSVGGTNANSLLGRFAYLNNEFKRFSQSLAEDEINHQPDIIFAEISHIPDGRTGNIARGIKLYDYQIPILTTTSNSKSIYLNDLFISIRNDEIILRSKKLNKRIMPRLCNAHNYQKSMIPAYKFLSAIQHQSMTGFQIHWGNWANQKRFLPRISYKNIILHRATWYLREIDVVEIKKSNNALSALLNFLNKWNIAQFICIVEADNELLIDTHNKSYLEILLEQIKTHSTIKLVEWLHDDNIEQNSSNYIQQFILPLSKKNIVPIDSLKSDAEYKNSIKRSFAPGSEWLYFKIYCSALFSDIILESVMQEAIRVLKESGIISIAFFIRYKDPHYHIRFRLLLSDVKDKTQLTVAMSLIHDLLQPFTENKSVWKIQMDTYEREIERYGANAIVKTEEAFYEDSLLFLKCLNSSEFKENDELRFLSGMKNIDVWLSLFDMDTTAKFQFCEDVIKNFKHEFGKQYKVQFDIKYRELKNSVYDFMQSNNFNLLFEERNIRLRQLGLPIDNLSNYIHMSQNRWFATKQRLLEYMSYYFCCRYYMRLLHDNTNL